MAVARASGPIVDLPLDVARTETVTNELPLGTVNEFGGGNCILGRANGADIVLGGLCGMTGVNDWVSLTSANVTSLSESDRRATKIGFAQALPTDNQVLWFCFEKWDSSDADLLALAGSAITAGTEVATTATEGEIDDSATGGYNLDGFSVVTDPGGGNTFSGWTAGNLAFDPIIVP